MGRRGISISKETTYNTKGQVETITDKYGQRTNTETFTYDSRGRVSSDQHSSGAGVTYEYGNSMVTATDAAGRIVTKTFDAAGNVLTVTDLAQTIEYQYYSNGKPHVISTGGVETLMEYDGFGRRTKLIDPDAGTTTTTYGKNGQIKTETDGRGVKTTYTYDALGRVTQRKRENPSDKYLEASITTYTYGTTGNEKGRIVKKDCDGKAVTYEYDNIGRVISESRGLIYNHDGTQDELRKTYTYNSNGQLRTVTFPTSHSTKGLTIGYVYDYDGTLRQMLYDNKPSNRLYMSYGNDGLKMQSRSDYLGKVTSYFDNDGYLTSRDYNYTYYNKNKEKCGISDTLMFSWDKTTGNLLSKTIRNQSECYAYDNLDRLTGVSRNNVENMAIGYADNGNIVSKSGIGEYIYDALNKPHAVREVENIDGVIDSREVYTQYDLNGKVAAIGDKDYTAFSWYEYGPDDEKWSSWGWSPDDVDLGWDVERTYWGDYERLTIGNRIREYYFLDNDVFLIRTNPYYDIDEPDIWDVNYYQMERDNIGNVVAIYNLSHRKVFEAEYDAWGRQTVIKDEICFNKGFTGHEMLPHLGLVHMDGRVYDPVLGRFLSPDNYVQLPENSQSFNRYSYCINNPLKYTDPTGQLFGIDDALLIIGATIVGSGALNLAFNWNEGEGILHKVGSFFLGAGSSAMAILGGPIGLIGGGATLGAGNYINNQHYSGSEISGQELLMSTVMGAVTAGFGSALGEAVSPIANSIASSIVGKTTLDVSEKIATRTISNIIGSASVGTAMGAIFSFNDPETSVLEGALQGMRDGLLAGLVTSLAQGFVDYQLGQYYNNRYPQGNGAQKGTEKTLTLKVGEEIDRYGLESGRFASPVGTAKEQRSLPFKNNNTYLKYIVNQEFQVESAIAAPWFNQPGGGTQYFLPKSIGTLLNEGYIRRASYIYTLKNWMFNTYY